jgi:N-acetylglucosaminyldiphosphoundecaprenol N-acetyl-beta-D-mannosaminyltransferase
MAEQQGKVPAVMLGVGAAFDFHAGTKSQAPAWMQAVGLEWFFRLIHEPRRLAKRYLYNNPRFILLALADLLGILDKGKKEA